ncbi:hypothetical protein BROUX41_002335 [Berkeleyomyces rouxiae]|uniref:uncharacterized protein n=1 Tax=Berkeleyomyces rouxiae TaxID=2035830 RepID=UPI003B81FF8A
MVKRKRETLTIEAALSKARQGFFKAIKTAKGFERQRLAKRLREPGVTPEKKQRLEMEVTTLKSLDLDQTATAHLYSVLNRIPTIAQHPELPEFVRRGVPKPDITADQKAALHTVTSSLFSRPNVRQVVDSTLEEVCMVLDVQQPEKKRSRSRKADFAQADDTEKAPTGQLETAPKAAESPVENRKLSAKEQRDEMRRKLLEGINMDAISGDDDDEEGEDLEEFSGFSDDESGEESNEDEDVQGEGDIDSDAQEAAISKMDALLGGSDSSDESDSPRKAHSAASRKASAKTIRVRDISVSLSPEGSSESESESEDNTLRSKATLKSQAKAKAKGAKSTADSTFLPSLMGGYVSGSESEASDLDIAPARKNRLGQRQRQAIWEKRFGDKAKHRQADAKKQSGKDASWDAKRGAVFDGGKPWKKGVDPFTKTEAKSDKPKKIENGNGGTGALHPSWEARKKAQEQKQKIKINGAPAAKKITFDD